MKQFLYLSIISISKYKSIKSKSIESINCSYYSISI